jgi:hypothetical protein
MREEVYQYVTELSHGSAYMFSNSDFIMNLAYLSDIFEKLNAFNSSLQGSDCNILQLSDKLKSFI